MIKTIAKFDRVFGSFEASLSLNADEDPGSLFFCVNVTDTKQRERTSFVSKYPLPVPFDARLVSAGTVLRSSRCAKQIFDKVDADSCNGADLASEICKQLPEALLGTGLLTKAAHFQLKLPFEAGTTNALLLHKRHTLAIEKAVNHFGHLLPRRVRQTYFEYSLRELQNNFSDQADGIEGRWSGRWMVFCAYWQATWLVLDCSVRGFLSSRKRQLFRILEVFRSGIAERFGVDLEEERKRQQPPE